MTAIRSSWAAGTGQGLTYGSAGFTAANFNSLAVGSVVVASSAITNSTSLDLYADVSFVFTNGATTTVAGNYMALYLLPLNQDGSTYGDATANGTTAPSASYLVGSAGILVGVGSGATMAGTFRGVVMPPSNFKFAIVSNIAGALNAAAAATVSYRTYNENLNT